MKASGYVWKDELEMEGGHTNICCSPYETLLLLSSAAPTQKKCAPNVLCSVVLDARSWRMAGGKAADGPTMRQGTGA